MREIKFRVWDNEKKKMEYLKPLFLNNAGISWENFDNRLIPMQFTGLKDKNGEEIYEGDILRHKVLSSKTHYLEVYWKDYKYHFRNKKEPKSGHPFRQIINHPENFEVIGHIYFLEELCFKIKLKTTREGGF